MLPFRILKSPIRPTSIRTLGGAYCSRASWMSSIHSTRVRAADRVLDHSALPDRQVVRLSGHPAFA
jgi:hypothetical protein